MKKMLTLVLTIALFVAIAAPALATSFSIVNMQCTNANDLDIRYSGAWSEAKWVDDQSIYVAHSVDSVPGATDTNMLHAVRRQGPSGNEVLAAKKWVTPVGGGGIPIQGNTIYASYYIDYYYSLAGRGNTNYYTKYGFTHITIRGNFNANYY